MTTALLLIDIQNDYFPGGKMELEGSLEASLRAREILAFFREKAWPLVHIQHVAIRPGATFFLPDTEGVKIHQNVEPLLGEVVFQKNYPNSFRDTPLLEHFREKQVDQVVVCGPGARVLFGGSGCYLCESRQRRGVAGGFTLVV